MRRNLEVNLEEWVVPYNSDYFLGKPLFINDLNGMSEKPRRVVLTIAGFDPSSGAGVTADLKTVAAHGLYGVSGITALTVQTTLGVSRSEAVRPKLLRETLDALVVDMPPAAVKIGMLGSEAIAAEIADFLRVNALKNVVLDPVLRSSSGTELLDVAGLRILRGQLLGMVDVVTPNVDEASVLTGLPVADEAGMELACRELLKLGARSTVVKGGHLPQPVDLLATRSSNGTFVFHRFQNEKVETNSTHGTGCAYSTAIACHLAIGRSLEGADGAVMHARDYVASALKEAYPVGKGTGPINHFHSARQKI
jgi:hydroxymethylpyrimidine/phosphomethylpyrimidine kinase